MIRAHLDLGYQLLRVPFWACVMLAPWVVPFIFWLLVRP